VTLKQPGAYVLRDGKKASCDAVFRICERLRSKDGHWRWFPVCFAHNEIVPKECILKVKRLPMRLWMMA